MFEILLFLVEAVFVGSFATKIGVFLSQKGPNGFLSVFYLFPLAIQYFTNQNILTKIFFEGRAVCTLEVNYQLVNMLQSAAIVDHQ